MSRCIRLSFYLFVGILLSSKACFGQISYSIPPFCREGEVICGENEEAVCLVSISDLDNVEQGIRYIPSCDGEPICIIEGTEIPAPSKIKPNCIELAQCQDNELHCSSGRIAKCFESSDEPQGCNCPSGVPTVCEDTWRISNIDSKLH